MSFTRAFGGIWSASFLTVMVASFVPAHAAKCPSACDEVGSKALVDYVGKDDQYASRFFRRFAQAIRIGNARFVYRHILDKEFDELKLKDVELILKVHSSELIKGKCLVLIGMPAGIMWGSRG